MWYVSANVHHRKSTNISDQLFKSLGFSSINAQGMTVAPYLVGWFVVFFQAWHSDRMRDRGWHIMLSCAVSFIGYIILATSVQKSVGATYFALFLVVGGNYYLFPLIMWDFSVQFLLSTDGIYRSWAANTFSPTSKRGVGMAFIVSISNCVSMYVSFLSIFRWLLNGFCIKCFTLNLFRRRR